MSVVKAYCGRSPATGGGDEEVLAGTEVGGAESVGASVAEGARVGVSVAVGATVGTGVCVAGGMGVEVGWAVIGGG